MRSLLASIVMIYLVGVGVALSPAINWSSSPSDFISSVAQALPDAAAWPARAFRSFIDRVIGVLPSRDE